MNRSLSFSISFVAHVTCVAFLMFMGKNAEEKPVVLEVCRVSLFAPGPLSASPPGPSEKGAAERAPVARARPAPKPVFFTTTATRQKPRRQEPPSDFTEIAKLEREMEPPPRPARGVAATGRLSVSAGGTLSSSTGGSFSYDALIAAVIRNNWVRPSRSVVGDDPPSVSVAIRIAIDGRITQSRVARSSGIALLDASAVKAIERSNPLPIGLPADIASRYYDVTIVFRITEEA